MKKILLSLVALLCATVNFAQGSLIATLSHEGQITNYYGSAALEDALNASSNGDVITLSGGQFKAVNINKAVIIRGAGMSIGTKTDDFHEATTILGDYSINIPGTPVEKLIIESIYMNDRVNYSGNITNAQFLKCRFKSINYSETASLSNVTFVHCRFAEYCVVAPNSDVYFVNSVVSRPWSANNSSTVKFDNCIVTFQYGSKYIGGSYNGFSPGGKGNQVNGKVSDVYQAYYKNSILCSDWNSNPNECIPNSCTAYNCVGIHNRYLFKYMNNKNTTNKDADSADIFSKFSVSEGSDVCITDYQDLTLTESAAAEYLGLDGTQVGIYGGSLVYNETPTAPRITKCNVASKSTADGKLSIEIEVKDSEF